MLTSDSIIYCNNRLRWFFWSCGYSGKVSMEIPKQSRVFWYINDWLYRNRTNPDFKNPLPAHADEYVRQDKHLKAGESLNTYPPYVPLHFFCPQCGKEMRSANEITPVISHLNSSLLIFFKMLVVVGLIFFIFYIIEGSQNGAYSDYYSFLWVSLVTLIVGIVGASFLNDKPYVRSKPKV